MNTGFGALFSTDYLLHAANHQRLRRNKARQLETTPGGPNRTLLCSNIRQKTLRPLIDGSHLRIAEVCIIFSKLPGAFATVIR